MWRLVSSALCSLKSETTILAPSLVGVALFGDVVGLLQQRQVCLRIDLPVYRDQRLEHGPDHGCPAQLRSIGGQDSDGVLEDRLVGIDFRCQVGDASQHARIWDSMQIRGLF